MRTLILVLAGHTGVTQGDISTGTDKRAHHTGYKPPASAHSNNNNSYGGNNAANSSGSVLTDADENAAFLSLVGRSRAHIKRLKEVLPWMVMALVNHKSATDVMNLAFDPCAMPVIKALMRAVGARVRKVNHIVTLEKLIARMLGWKLDESATAEARAAAESAGIEAAKAKAKEEDEDAASDLAAAAAANSDDDDDENDDEESKSRKKSKKDDKKDQKKHKKSGNDDDDAGESEELPLTNLVWQLGPGSVKHVNDLFTDPVASHFMEALFLSSPPALLQSFLFKHTQNKLLSLAKDRMGNHAVQRLFGALRDETSYTLCYEQLKDDLFTLVKEGKAGVVWQVVEAARRIGCRQSAVAKQVMGVFGGQRKGNREGQLVIDVLTLNARDPATAAEGKGGEDGGARRRGSDREQGDSEFTRGNYLGAQILSSLFGFAPQAAAPFFASLTALPGPVLTALLRDPTGARAVESYVVSRASARYGFRKTAL